MLRRATLPEQPNTSLSHKFSFTRATGCGSALLECACFPSTAPYARQGARELSLQFRRAHQQQVSRPQRPAPRPMLKSAIVRKGLGWQNFCGNVYAGTHVKIKANELALSGMLACSGRGKDFEEFKAKREAASAGSEAHRHWQHAHLDVEQAAYNCGCPQGGKLKDHRCCVGQILLRPQPFVLSGAHTFHTVLLVSTGDIYRFKTFVNAIKPVLSALQTSAAQALPLKRQQQSFQPLRQRQHSSYAACAGGVLCRILSCCALALGVPAILAN
eukprot:1999377-Pleurochrysis_carterae.AAC.6